MYFWCEDLCWYVSYFGIWNELSFNSVLGWIRVVFKEENWWFIIVDSLLYNGVVIDSRKLLGWDYFYGGKERW